MTLPKPTSDHTPIHLRFSTNIPKTSFSASRTPGSSTGSSAQPCSQRLRRNNIRLLEVCGIAVSSHQDKTAVLTDHLRGLLDANGPTTGSLDLAALYSGSATVDAAPLITPFTEPEA
jgi:hypothetical protein